MNVPCMRSSRRGARAARREEGVWTTRRILRFIGRNLLILVGVYLMLLGVLGAVGGGMGFLYL